MYRSDEIISPVDDKNDCSVKREKSKNVKGKFTLFSFYHSGSCFPPPPSSPLSHSSDEITPLVDDKTSTQTTSNRNRNFIREDQN